MFLFWKYFYQMFLLHIFFCCHIFRIKEFQEAWKIENWIKSEHKNSNSIFFSSTQAMKNIEKLFLFFFLQQQTLSKLFNEKRTRLKIEFIFSLLLGFAQQKFFIHLKSLCFVFLGKLGKLYEICVCVFFIYLFAKVNVVVSLL